MSGFSLKRLALTILIALLACSSSFQACSARKAMYTRQLKTIGKGYDGYNYQDPKLMDEGNGVTPLKNTGSSTFNVLHFGAKGDGKADDTKAFEAAWAAACQVRGSTMMVPSGSVFLVKPITFSGPNCETNIVFQLDGKIIAPRSSSAWGSGFYQWLDFSKLQGITIRGKGTIDGQGSIWWNDSTDESESETPTAGDSLYSSKQDSISGELSAKMPSTKPTALRFYGSSVVTVTGITIQNSPQTHLKFDDCTGVQVSGVTVSSPGDSPNTDGIHLQNSQNVVIYSTNLACGDDCVSIQTGCSNIFVHNVNCGPGHGISIGGLGRDNTKACVKNVTVRDITMQDTMTGVRIKTWQGGSGSVSGVMFSNIQVSRVKTPIMIDQFYCDKSRCQNETKAVAVSDINYVNIRGTYTVNPVHFACSDSLPCSGVTLTTIQLKPAQEVSQSNGPFCWETYGELKTNTIPPIDCLQRGKPSKNQLHSNGDSC
ncbi:Polygalacturonase [Vitis vinifera]|uniref:Polygalacturonase n=1 Tax=Vitis vinifera TaxID=29760 RepID=A0A438EFR6_VITVI|nr:Polygalacturonase [Vitis vinifera]